MPGLKEKVKVFTNKFGEVMVMRMDQNGDITIFHEDCNEQFEPGLLFAKKYILNEEEADEITKFVTECIECVKAN